MFANIEDAKSTTGGLSGSGGVESAKDPEFLDQHWRDEVLSKWPLSPVRSKWLESLLGLEQELDAAIKRTLPFGAFVKLSVRSPKDAVFCLPSYTECVREFLEVRGLERDSPLLLSQNVAAIRHASWQGLRCKTGGEALRLLLRSERVYLDVLQHELFTQKNNEPFNLVSSPAPPHPPSPSVLRSSPDWGKALAQSAQYGHAKSTKSTQKQKRKRKSTPTAPSSI